MTTTNLLFLNGDGMTNVNPEKQCAQINDEWHCKMSEEEFEAYIIKHNLTCINGELLDKEDLHKYGTVLELRR